MSWNPQGYGIPQAPRPKPKRVVHVSRCKCGDVVETSAWPPRERRCKCGEWAPYVQEER